MNLLVLALLGGVQVTSQPASLVSGAETTARIEVNVTGAAAQEKGDAAPALSLTTNVGEITDVRRVGRGRYEATFRSPRTRFPQVALVLAEVRAGGTLERGWFPLPLHGTQTLKLKTKRGAKVDVELAGAHAGSAVANERGDADVQVFVPPGITHAQIRSLDRLGNRKVKDLFLDPPPFPRIRFAPVPATGASWSDASPLALELFAVAANGKPATPALSASADVGRVASIKSAGGGVHHIHYRPPERYAGHSSAQVRAWLKETGNSDAQLAQVPLRGGPPDKLALTLSTKEVRADGDRRVKVSAQAWDARGNVADFTLPVIVETDVGTAVRADEAHWVEIPQRYGAKEKATIRGKIGKVGSKAELALLAGPPARVVPETEAPFKVRAGESERVDVQVEDAFGNAVRGVSLAAVTSTGVRLPVRERGNGEYGIHLDLPESTSTGETVLELRTSTPKDEPIWSERLVVLPQRRGSIFVGAVATGQSNLGQARGGGLSLVTGIRPTRFPVELMANVGASAYPRRTMSSQTGLSSVDLQAAARAVQAGAGARLMLELNARLAMHVGGVAGIQRTWSELALSPSAGLGDYRERQVRNSPWLRATTGMSTVLGPGRALVEVQGSYAAPGGQLGPGNVGGLAVGLGYEIIVR